MDKMSQREYLSYLMAMRDERARMATAIDRGLEMGRTKGFEEGREEGRQEKLAMVRAMKGQGIPIETIAICSGLSIDEIMAL